MSDNCIVCLNVGARYPKNATLSTLATVVGLGIEQVMRDLCTKHSEAVNAAVRHAQAVTGRHGQEPPCEKHHFDTQGRCYNCPAREQEPQGAPMEASTDPGVNWDRGNLGH